MRKYVLHLLCDVGRNSIRMMRDMICCMHGRTSVRWYLLYFIPIWLYRMLEPLATLTRTTCVFKRIKGRP